jgi:hypothetical protein
MPMFSRCPCGRELGNASSLLDWDRDKLAGLYPLSANVLAGSSRETWARLPVLEGDRDDLAGPYSPSGQEP